MLAILKFYSRFEIDDATGERLTERDMQEIHYTRFSELQKAAFKHLQSDLRDFALKNIASCDSREDLQERFSPLRWVN